jgi:hypothetical protein
VRKTAQLARLLVVMSYAPSPQSASKRLGDLGDEGAFQCWLPYGRASRAPSGDQAREAAPALSAYQKVSPTFCQSVGRATSLSTKETGFPRASRQAWAKCV